MSEAYLLDANALIALVVAEHEHHARVAVWSAGVATLALCPIVEGAMVRYLMRIGETAATASQLLSGLHASAKIAFWPDAISYTGVALDHVIGHRQVTDAYLVSLASSHSARLATFDAALASTLPAQVTLIP